MGQHDPETHLNMSSFPLIIRADASITTGTGHIMRCLAIAQAAQSIGLNPVFVTSEASAIIHSKLDAEKLRTEVVPHLSGSREDAEWTATFAKNLNAQWVVVDGYAFGSDYQGIIKNHGLKLLFVDDYGHCDRYCADIVLNQNIYAEAALYADREPYTELLLGTKYCLLRKEFYPYIGKEIVPEDRVRNILITFGGTDPEHKTLPFLNLLNSINEDFSITVIVGGGNDRYDAIKRFAEKTIHQTRVLRNVDNMPELMKSANLAISASGTTVWELMFLGVPTIAMAVADNQEPIVDYLAREGLAFKMGRHADLSDPTAIHRVHEFINDAQRRKAMALKGRKYVNGTGAFRVASCFASLSFRPVDESDCEWIWQLANEPLIREVSFASDLIPWETHIQWFQAKIDSEDCVYLVAENLAGKIVGHVRFDCEGGEADISLTIVKEFRGRGYAVELIRSACRELLESGRVSLVHAYIKPENVASVNSFKHAGFTEIEPVNEGRLHFILKKP